MCNNATTDGHVLTAQEVVEAVTKAVHFSNSMDCAVRRSIMTADFERNWARLGAFITSLSMSLDAVAPGVFRQIAEFQEDVVFERNPLAKPAAASGEPK